MPSYCNKSPPNIRGSTQCLFLAWASPLHLSGCLRAASGLGGGGGGRFHLSLACSTRTENFPLILQLQDGADVPAHVAYSSTDVVKCLTVIITIINTLNSYFPEDIQSQQHCPKVPPLLP